MAKKQEVHNVGKVLGTLGVAAAAVGAYMLYGSKEGEARRQKAKSWMLKMKGDVLEKIEDAKEVTEDTYKSIVDEVAVKYKAAKNVDVKELGAVVGELKDHWQSIKGQFVEGEVKARKKKK